MTEAKPAVIHTEPADRWEPQRKPRGNNEEVIRQWPGKNNAKMIWTKFASENCVWCQERNLRNTAGLTAVQPLGLDKRDSPSVRRRRSEA